MKNIGILTYHRATNYGAVLQAYSFAKQIKTDFPSEKIEIIDYSTRMATNDHTKDVLRTVIEKGIQYGYDVYKKNQMFKAFSDCLPLSKRTIVSDRICSASEYLNERYDVVISGSDAVFSWNGKVFPTLYLLGDNGTYKRLSYAASAHRLFYKVTEKEKIEYCKNAFSKYEYIGVRDRETEQFVKYCDSELITYHNCDPTILLNISLDNNFPNNLDIEKKFGITNNKPMIIVMSPDVIIGRSVVMNFGDEYNVVSVFVHNDAVRHHCSLLTPFEWASLFRYAKVTVTEYFHATILSLLNGTPTVSIDKLKRSSGYEGKIYDLLYTRLNLSDFYLNVDDLQDEPEEIIKKKVHFVLEKDYATIISDSLKKEKAEYISFKEALGKALL